MPFTDVKVSDSFWTPRIEANRTASLPQNLQICRETGRIGNFAKAAGMMEGKYEGYFFNDSDVYKMLEGIANSLAVSPDPKLEKQADEIIELIAAAQRPDGYINTYYTLNAPDRRWTNVRAKHELYCTGHLIEAAVAYYQATGKRMLLDAAEKFVDHIDLIFGLDKLREPPGHEEIELALVKLYRLTGKTKYLKLAEFFIDMRGEPSRPQRWGTEYQDHALFRSQDEIHGHAVRAMYLCAGATDVAVHNGDRSLIEALDRLWTSMTERKMYITGGVGSRHQREEFGFDFELPNDTGYCETCAAIGVAFWTHRMNLLHADAQYADVMERAMYNNILSGVGLDGKTYFYVNPLASDGKHHRKAYHKCSCCPINLVRFLPTLPGYIYATGESGGSRELYVNLYASGRGDVKIGGNRVRIKQETKYPWDGKTRLTFGPDKPETFTLCLRIPGWCRGATVSIGGQTVEPLTIEKGYARFNRRVATGRRGRVEPADADRADRGQSEAERRPRPRGGPSRTDRLLF